jgi:AraC-like DNA-binding protein
MMDATTLIEDDEILVTDVRCVGAPRPHGPIELPTSVELVIPLAGLFERLLFTNGTHRAGATYTADPSRIHLFRPAAPYRVSHPIGGADRSIAIAIRDGLSDRETYPDDIPAPPIAHTLARRLAAAIAHGTVDELTAAEVARTMVDISLGWFDRLEMANVRDRSTARRIRLAIAEKLGKRMTLPELGRGVGLSGWEVARRFRRATGTSIHRYRTALRVQAALERIEQGERDLAVLGLDLGFAHHSHLTNALRAALGSPPSAFRRPPTPSELAGLRTILQA